MGLFYCLRQRLQKRCHLRIGQKLHQKLGIHSGRYCGCNCRFCLNCFRFLSRHYLTTVKCILKELCIGLAVLIQDV